ncbi:hypothetical protein Goshw_007215, partial [Gossypium schwendimanii]|nr:hypothetical protein [Gossypium schwendimanii]
YVNELDELNRRLLVRRVVGEQWRPPKVSKVKINFDATFHKQSKKLCSGIMVKDSNGQLLNFKICLNKYIPTAFTVKALVFAQTIQFGLDLGIERVVIEEDSL